MPGGTEKTETFQAARSVHVWWQPQEKGEEIVSFYNQVHVKSTTPGSYFMVCGFAGGYFGVQDMRDGSRRVLFSVWDASSEMNQGNDDPSEISLEERVEILHEAPDVLVKRFGGEGTGAQCLDDSCGWDVGGCIRCLVQYKKSTCGRACYAAFVQPSAAKEWKHIASYRVACGKPFEGFYSFIEDFRRDVESTGVERNAMFGPAWFQSSAGDWRPATSAKFTASGAEWERPDNIDISPGSEPGMQTLATGGNNLQGMHKLKSSFLLAPGRDGPPIDCPASTLPSTSGKAPTMLEGPAVLKQPACPLCGGELSSTGGPMCGDDTCEPMQCVGQMPGASGRCLWPRSNVCPTYGTFRCNEGSLHPQAPVQVDSNTWIFGGYSGGWFKMRSVNLQGQGVEDRHSSQSALTVENWNSANLGGAYHVDDVVLGPCSTLAFGVLAVFKAWDTDGDGAIDIEELTRVLKETCGLDDDECKVLFDQADANQDGKIQYEEFLNWLECDNATAQQIAQDVQAWKSKLQTMFDELSVSLSESFKCNADQIADEVLQNSDVMMSLLQWQLLSLLGTPGVDGSSFRPSHWDVLQQGVAKELLFNRELLEAFLSSGDCSLAIGAHSDSPKEPEQRWANAVSVLGRILNHDTEARSGLKMRLAVATALTFSSPLFYFADCFLKDPADRHHAIDPVARYDNFYRWHEEGVLFPTFATCNAWQLRYVVGSWLHDYELEWARQNCPEDCKCREKVGEAVHGMVPYKLYNDEGVSIHKGPPDYPHMCEYYNFEPITLELMHKVGGVCGNISKFGTGMSQAFGVPAMPVAQPGHCAFLWQKAPGCWALSNDVSGWAKSTKHDSMQMPWGKKAWLVPLMENAQSDMEKFSKSERLRVAAEFAPVEAQGDLLALATKSCPFNMAVWEARIEFLAKAFDAGHDADKDDWVCAFRQEFRNHQFIVSHVKPVTASDPETKVDRIVDCSNLHWCTKEENAWFEVDLEQKFHIKRVEIQWWGTSVAKSYRLLASDGGEFMEQRSQSDATENPEGYNSWSVIPGWACDSCDSWHPTSRLRCELADGSLDPWGQGMMFGIRQCNVYGVYCQPPAAAPDVLKIAASNLLSNLTVTTAEGATAADAGDYPIAQNVRETNINGPLAIAVEYISEKIDATRAKLHGRPGVPIENLSLALDGPRPGHVQVSSGEDRAGNLVDGTNSEWWTEEKTAWIEVDLQEPCAITSLQIHWWGYSIAKCYKVLSSSDGISFKEQRFESDATSDGASGNPWHEIPGWDDITTHVRMELADGQEDPWGKGMWLGIREFNVMGRPY